MKIFLNSKMYIFLAFVCFQSIFAADADKNCKGDVCEKVNKGGYTSTGGDPMMTLFERARYDAVSRVRRASDVSFDSTVDVHVVNFIKENIEALAKDIELSEHHFTTDVMETCARTTLNEPHAFIKLSTVSCRGISADDATGLLIHESVHHFGGGEEFSIAVSTAILKMVRPQSLNAWCEALEQNELKQSEAFFIETLLETIGTYDCSKADELVRELREFEIKGAKSKDLSPLVVFYGSEKINKLWIETSSGDLAPLLNLKETSLDDLTMSGCTSNFIEPLFI